MLRTLITCGLILVASVARAADPPREAARMVVLKPHDGQQAEFEEGYKRHLEWHRAQKDSWKWYGWNVVAGDRMGFFIDGTFGLTWSELDTPVAPAEDAADNARNVTPHAGWVSHQFLRRRGDLSSGAEAEVLESPLLELFHVRIANERRPEFEFAVRSWNNAAQRKVSVYELVSGGEHPSYIMAVGLSRASQLVGVDPGSAGWARQVLSVKSELLRLRRDLSYVPEEK